jgi:hypothetical protein
MTHFRLDTVPSIAETQNMADGLIEIEIWDAFIVNHSCILGNFLAKNSVDNGPLMKDHLPHGRTCYRFTRQAWQRSVKTLLNRDRVPVLVRDEGSNF